MPSEEIAAILQALEHFEGEYEEEAVDAAIAHREEIVPLLIDCLEQVAAAPSVYLEDEDYYLHIYAFMLLGHFEETRAHQTIIKLFSLPEQSIDALFGDLLTEYLAMVLFRTCGGGFTAIKSLVLNRQAYEWSRGEAAYALVYGVAAGQLPRDEVLAFFSTLFTGEEAEPRSIFWGRIADCSLDLYPGEFMEVIKAAEEKGLLDSGLVVEEDFTKFLELSVEQCLARVRVEMARSPWDDPHSLMSEWDCFQEGRWSPYAFPADQSRSQDQKPKKKKKRKQAKASRRKNRR
jgi:hypothetical protein